jgi:predicted RecA/RadA family phage recombinase
MRRNAAGKFLSASKPGVYEMPKAATKAIAAGRSIELE